MTLCAHLCLNLLFLRRNFECFIISTENECKNTVKEYGKPFFYINFAAITFHTFN